MTLFRSSSPDFWVISAKRGKAPDPRLNGPEAGAEQTDVGTATPFPDPVVPPDTLPLTQANLQAEMVLPAKLRRQAAPGSPSGWMGGWSRPLEGFCPRTMKVTEEPVQPLSHHCCQLFS